MRSATPPASRCCWCGKEPWHFRLTLPRPITGDKVFDSWKCHEEWREDARVSAMLEE